MLNKILFYIKGYWKILLNNTIYKKKVLKAREEWTRRNIDFYVMHQITIDPLKPEECYTKEIDEEHFNRLKNLYNGK